MRLASLAGDGAFAIDFHLVELVEGTSGDRGPDIDHEVVAADVQALVAAQEHRRVRDVVGTGRAGSAAGSRPTSGPAAPSGRGSLPRTAYPAPPQNIGVVIAPGEMQFTRTPWEINSVAHTLVT